MKLLAQGVLANTETLSLVASVYEAPENKKYAVVRRKEKGLATIADAALTWDSIVTVLNVPGVFGNEDVVLAEPEAIYSKEAKSFKTPGADTYQTNSIIRFVF